MSDITDFLAFRQAVMGGDFAGAVSITEKLDRKKANQYWDTVNAEMAKALDQRHKLERGARKS